MKLRIPNGVLPQTGDYDFLLTDKVKSFSKAVHIYEVTMQFWPMKLHQKERNHL